MASILYIKASPRGSRSHSIAVADAFIDAYREQNPQAKVEILDLSRIALPEYDHFTIQAKYQLLGGEPLSELESDAWRAIEQVVAAFLAADRYVFAVPMWNFGIPYQLKHYLDVIVQPGLTFSYSPEEGYRGLVLKRRAFCAYARGGEYLAGTAGEDLEMQQRYLEMILRFIGIDDIRSVIVEPTAARGPEIAKAQREAAIARARKLAAGF